jgi:hypothetical protein
VQGGAWCVADEEGHAVAHKVRVATQFRTPWIFSSVGALALGALHAAGGFFSHRPPCGQVAKPCAYCWWVEGTFINRTLAPKFLALERDGHTRGSVSGVRREPRCWYPPRTRGSLVLLLPRLTAARRPA